jgi:excisionase family DNA binding protein
MPVQLCTVDEAAARLNTTAQRSTQATHGPGKGTPRFIRRLIDKRRIAFTRLGRHVRIESDAIEEFIAAGRVQARSPIPKPRSA